MYIGTFSDQELIKRLRQKDDNKHGAYVIADDYYQKKIDAGEIKDCTTMFFANSLQEAKSMAKELNLKNFSKVSSQFYELGIDY